MCLTCGCGRPNDDMGDPHNITLNHIKQATQTSAAKGLTPDDAIKNLQKTWDDAVKDEDKTVHLDQEFN